jgi:type I restriction enzyme R subunit
MTNEAFSRVKIDALLTAQGWDTLDTNAVRFEVMLPNGTRADYVLCDRRGRSIAVIEAKRFSVSPGDAAAQAKAYAQQLGVPYAFLSNGNEVLFWDWQREAFPRPVKTIFKQDDLERRVATLARLYEYSTGSWRPFIGSRSFDIAWHIISTMSMSSRASSKPCWR